MHCLTTKEKEKEEKEGFVASNVNAVHLISVTFFFPILDAAILDSAILDSAILDLAILDSASLDSAILDTAISDLAILDS